MPILPQFCRSRSPGRNKEKRLKFEKVKEATDSKPSSKGPSPEPKTKDNKDKSAATPTVVVETIKAVKTMPSLSSDKPNNTKEAKSDFGVKKQENRKVNCRNQRKRQVSKLSKRPKRRSKKK